MPSASPIRIDDQKETVIPLIEQGIPLIQNMARISESVLLPVESSEHWDRRPVAVIPDAIESVIGCLEGSGIHMQK